MTVAMRNERLAVQGRLTDVYLNHVAALQRQLTAHWRERQAALQSADRDSPADTFAAIVRSNLADSVPQTKTSAATMARSETLTSYCVVASPPCRAS